MLFTSYLIRENKDEQDIFCIDIDADLLAFIKRQVEWVQTNPDVSLAEFDIPSDRARLCEKSDLWDILDFKPDPLHGEDPLGYYRMVMDYGIPNQEYWDSAQFMKCEGTGLWLHRNAIGFKCRTPISRGGELKYFETMGMSHNDFFGSFA